MARRYSAEQWVAEQRESALSVRDYRIQQICDWIGVSQNAFYLWRRKLAAQHTRATVTQSSGSQQSDVRSLFVPLTVVGSPVIEVDLPCGTVVRVPNEEFSLRRVISILLDAKSTILRGSGEEPRV